MITLPAWLPTDSSPDTFPGLEFALHEPNGLLAAGGDLSAERLLCAYRRGIFPWYSEDQPILWWSPEPRAVLFPRRLKISRSLHRRLRSEKFEVTKNACFAAVIDGCAAPRDARGGTWITREMREAYLNLHALGYAVSVECWHEDQLVGGLYGVSLGKVFFGESMFSAMNDASKVALAKLCTMGYELIDCQMPSTHLSSLGAQNIPRTQFLKLLNRWCNAAPSYPIYDAGYLRDGRA